MKFWIVVLSIIFSANIYSYNHRKCMMATRNWAAPFNVFLSTSSFFTSTGDCAMIGSIQERKQQFIAFNLDELKRDSAKGSGEYLDAYANLSGCSTIPNNPLSSVLKRNFIQIYGSNAEHGPEKVYNSIEQIISSDPTLSKECQVES